MTEEKTKHLSISYKDRNEIMEFLMEIDSQIMDIDDLIDGCERKEYQGLVTMGRILEKLMIIRKQANVYCEVLEGLDK